MRKTNIHKQGGLNLGIKSAGYIIVLTIVLVVALLFITVQFLGRTSDSLQISGFQRDSQESLLLAESAMNKLYGQYYYKVDIDGDGKIDFIDQALNVDNPQNSELPYLYYVDSEDENRYMETPSILQRIANGEARGVGGSIDKNAVSKDTNQLLVENLYSNGGIQPIVYVLTSDNDLVKSNEKWSNIKDDETKVSAAWFEMVSNSDIDGDIQLYVQAIGKIGQSKSYVQRYIGSMSNRLGDQVGAANEFKPK